MTRQTDTLTTATHCAHGVDHDRDVPCRACEPIATYPFDRPDAARRHAGEVGGHVHLDDETGIWTVYGDPQREADRALRATGDKALLTQFARTTHAMHAATEAGRQARREGKRVLAQDKEAVARDLRACRDAIEAEVLRRMGGQA